MVYMKWLHSRALQMRETGRSAVSFATNYNGHPFSNLFIDVYKNPTLYITSLGMNPFTIKLEGNEDFQFGAYFGDCYSPLCEYLELHYDRDNPFKTTIFLEQYDELIRNAVFAEPRPRDIAEVVNTEERNVDEAQKIYFCGWHPLHEGYGVSDLNFKKTCGLVGYDEAVRLKKARVSSNWSADENMERLEKIAQSTCY